ncbi:unnamed protein product [Rhizophagus irregularis]|nr:unnamed protein product [Rhizophagus irregularis]
MKEGHTPHYTVKALIDTSSCENFIRKSVVDKLGISYVKPPQRILKRVPNARTPPSSDDERSRRSKQPKKHIISETLDVVNYKTSINQLRSPPHE